jgi:serine/threonine-protein kinase
LVRQTSSRSVRTRAAKWLDYLFGLRFSSADTETACLLLKFMRGLDREFAVVLMMGAAMTLEKIGRYEIVGQLGTGAMGVVYKAMDPMIGRTVALKTVRLDAHGAETSELLQRFRNEARMAGVLNHPNIVSIHDADEINGLFYMAMEYIEGKTLRQLLSEERVLPMEQVLELSRQIAAGLDAASREQVVHRDIKPANIMILANGSLKIMDFGIAKAVAGVTTSKGAVLGTPSYMSPEQIRGQFLDGRSDLFSFGVILYEMVTGARPFAGDNIGVILKKIVHEEPIPPRESNPAIHPGLERVLLKALAKSPEQRFQRGAELVHALENYESFETESRSTTVPASATESATTASTTAAAPQQSSDGTEAVGAPAMSATATRKPVAVFKFTSLLAVVAGFLAVIVLVLGAVVYLKYKQTNRTGEEQSQAQARRSETAEKAPSPLLPQTAAPPAPLPSPTPLADGSPDEAISSSNEPAPAATSLGELVVSTDPDGAEVKIDGKGQSWRTPFTASGVSLGPHTLTFNKNGYAAETRVIEVHADQRAFLRVSMNLLIPTSIGSDPAGAAIVIDGKVVSQVTPAQVMLSRGAHNITLRKTGFQEAVANIDVREDQVSRFAPTLKPLDHLADGGKAKDTHPNSFSRLFGGGDRVPVEIHTTPRGAEILVNGYRYSQTTPAKIALPPGEYQITLQLENYKPLQKTVIVGKGPAIQVEETLQK